MSEFVRISRPLTLSLEPIDLGELTWNEVEQARADLTSALKKRGDENALQRLQTVRCEIEQAAPLPTVRGDRDLLARALHAVATNAFEALIGRRDDAPRVLSVRFEVHPTRVVVEIEDNGRGLRERVVQRAFFPFFTMKPDHDGQGLPWARRAVEAHGGLIDLAPLDDHGAIASLALPIEGPPRPQTA